MPGLLLPQPIPTQPVVQLRLELRLRRQLPARPQAPRPQLQPDLLLARRRPGGDISRGERVLRGDTKL